MFYNFETEFIVPSGTYEIPQVILGFLSQIRALDRQWLSFLHCYSLHSYLPLLEQKLVVHSSMILVSIVPDCPLSNETVLYPSGFMVSRKLGTNS